MKKEFEELGFKIVAQGKLSLTISSSKKYFEKMFGIQLKQIEHPIFQGKTKHKAKYFAFDDQIKIPESLVDLVERITLPQPIQFCQSATPPTINYYHMNVPDDIAKLIKAVGPHTEGWTGAGILYI